MPEPRQPAPARAAPGAARTIARHAAILVAIALPLYFLVPAAGGILNWQEGTRALVSREMQRNAEWIVPTIFGEPYLNKPPLFYWLIILVAEARQHTATFADARIAAALGAVAGVVTTYALTIPLARRLAPELAAPNKLPLWSALFLITGTLFVRSGRMAEIDILYTGPVFAAVACSLLAWHNAQQRGSFTHRAALIAAATVAAALASLAKGPPPLAAIFIGAVLAPAIVTARRIPEGPAPTKPKLIAGSITAAVFVIAGLLAPDDAQSLPGFVVMAALGAVLAAWVTDLARPAACRAWWPPLRRTHPWIVLGIGTAALVVWLLAAQSAIGGAEVSNTVEHQTAHNLVLFEPNAAWRNLGYLAYAVGVGSLFTVFALIWIAKDREPIPPLVAIFAVWTVLGLALFSLFGKGVARYMTPMWPTVAVLGAATMLMLAAKHPGIAATLKRASAAVVILLALVQSHWYAIARDAHPDPDSTRSLHQHILESGIDTTQLVFIDKGSRELAFYLDHPTPDFDLRDEPESAARDLTELINDTGPRFALAVDQRDRDLLQQLDLGTPIRVTPADPGEDDPRLFKLTLTPQD